MPKVSITIDVEVDPDWISFCTSDMDVFMHDHCGYWMYGMEQDDALGWLVYVHDEEWTVREVAKHPEYPSIVQAWQDNKPLPERWYRLNEEAAIKAWVEGCKRDGVNWFENGDANTYDVAIQKALLGEVVYG